jgi:pantoate--beta-alanine ligase
VQIVHGISELDEAVKHARDRGLVIGLVPTMGALHEGHAYLIRRLRQDCGFLIVSVFVNPTQFGPGEDYDRYPRTLLSDSVKCEKAGADLVFAPSTSDMYPDGFDAWVEVGGPTEILEGERRPGHFRGVTTVVAKLFNVTNADLAAFGLKDYQQLKVIQKMVRDLNMKVRVVPVQIMRENDGLAMSSRNAYLSTEERVAAVVLNRALKETRAVFENGERNAFRLRMVAENCIRKEPLAHLDYVEVRDAETLGIINEAVKPVVVLLAVKIGKTRLIDNTVLS